MFQRNGKWLSGLVMATLVTLCAASLPGASQGLRERLLERYQQRMAAQSENAPVSMPLHSFSYGGMQRSYLIFLPRNYEKAHQAPLLIMLHGGGGNAENTQRIAPDLNSYASRKGVIVVYPNGTGASGTLGSRRLTWNAGNCCGAALDNQVDDVGFIRALIGSLRSQYRIDERRIYATGFSNGAMLAERLGCELSDTLAGIAPVSGSLKDNCHPTDPLSVILFNGTDDQHVLYQGGQGAMQADRKHPRNDHSVAYALDFWARHDHCPAMPERIQQGHIVRESYDSCQAGTTVVLYTIEGGGHAWPGGYSFRGGQQPTQEISASRQIIDFMLAHPKIGK